MQNDVYDSLKVGDCVKPLKNKVSITLDEDIIERVKELAENDDRSFSQYINMVLKEWVGELEND
jgi:predicted DNA-binding protein